MRLLTIFGALLGMYSAHVIADCWVVTNLHGYGAMAADNWMFSQDNITNGVFQISNDGKNSSVVIVGKSLQGTDLQYVPVNETTSVGVYSDLELTTVETWSITNDKKVLYTKVINSLDNSWSASRSMIGDVVGYCDKSHENNSSK
ncbi:hypothetical protein [Aeromonas caviae]|uniref:hypothetical protein n=1 Tax=Aeromonas caviae TaxID=648 RepID=UPI0038D0CF2B